MMLFGERRNGIPRTFVVDAEGRLAWIGYPKKLEEVLPKIIINTWEIKQESTKRNFSRYLRELDDSLRFNLMPFEGDPGKPDSALLMIDEMVKNEPQLKYAPFIASQTFISLLKTDPHKAYEYGKQAMVTSIYEEPPYDLIIGDIRFYSDKINFRKEIFELGAEAYQEVIDSLPYPEIADLSRLYYQMAEWYWRANNKSKAIDAQQKALDALKNEENFSMTDMIEFNSKLEEYRKM
ncbi:MAG TPA: hypothetical protein VGI82_07650 [Chitinophagaceae bacterium]